MGTVRIGEWVASGGAGDDGFFIDTDGLSGWDDGTDYRVDEVARPQAHGSFEIPAFSGSRRVSVSGLCLADSEERLGWYKSQLSGVLADGKFGRIVVDYQGITSWANVQRVTSKFKTIVPGSVARYQLQVWAADPRKYGETRTFGPATSMTAHHYGNFPAAPVVTVSGSAPSGYTIHGPGGRSFVVTRALAPGSPHRIDFATGRLSVGGVLQVGAVSRAQTWAIPGGARVVMSVVPMSGSAVMSVAVSDTYI